MTPKKYKIIIIVLVIVIALLAIRVIFDSKFDDFKNMVKWTNEYKVNYPNASDEEIDKAFKDAWKK